MQTGVKIGLGVGIGALAIGGTIAAVVAAQRGEGIGGSGAKPGEGDPGTRAIGGPTSSGDTPAAYPWPYDGQPVDPATDYPPYGEPVPGGGTSPGDEPLWMPVRGRIDPPGFFGSHGFDGSLRGTQLDATIDPGGWGDDVRLTGRVDHGGFSTRVDPYGWGNDTTVEGTRTLRGYEGSVDRPGIWNDTRLSIDESVRGASVIRSGRFDETLVPSYLEATFRSGPGNGSGRMLEFDPPGWEGSTRVSIDSNAPAGVEATIAAHLFNEWKLDQEREADYPDPGYPYDPGVPSYPSYPSYPTYPTYPTDPSYPDPYPGGGTGSGDEPYPGSGWDSGSPSYPTPGIPSYPTDGWGSTSPGDGY